MNVKNYVNDEVIVAEGWLDKISVEEYEICKGNTSDLTATDVIIKLPYGTVKAEVKIEDYWPYVTGNITLDAISVFEWIGDPVQINRIAKLLPYIRIHKLGTFYESNDDILIKMIRDTKANKQDFFAFDIKRMMSLTFRRHIESRCAIKVNPKKRYGLDDTWESAFFCVPIIDPLLQAVQICNSEELYMLITKDYD